MFPLILTALNRHYHRGYENPMKDCLYKGGTSQHSDMPTQPGVVGVAGYYHSLRIPKRWKVQDNPQNPGNPKPSLGFRVQGLGFRAIGQRVNVGVYHIGGT